MNADNITKLPGWYHQMIISARRPLKKSNIDNINVERNRIALISPRIVGGFIILAKFE